MNKPNIKIRGVPLTLELTDADTIERTLPAIKACVAGINAASNANISEAEKIRKICAAVRTCFDDIFGDCTGIRVCGDKDQWDICTNAFVDLCEAAEKVQQATTAKIEKRTEALNKKIAEKRNEHTDAAPA